MTEVYSLIDQALPFLAVVGQVAILILALLLVASRFQKQGNALTEFVSAHALWLAFVVALTATLGSLFYSEILGYEPCKLCWYQRILMYPQALLLGMAVWKKDSKIADYIIALSAVGAAIAAFHYYGQVFNASLLACDAVGQSVSCARQFVMDFGYITIPMMALTGFVLTGLLMIAKKVYNNKVNI